MTDVQFLIIVGMTSFVVFSLSVLVAVLWMVLRMVVTGELVGRRFMAERDIVQWRTFEDVVESKNKEQTEELLGGLASVIKDVVTTAKNGKL